MFSGAKFVVLPSKRHRMQASSIYKPLPDIFRKFSTHAFYFSLIPFFVLIFGAIYKPFNVESFLETPKASYAFNLTMVMCIVLLVVLSFRMILYFTRIIRHLSMNWYRMWCVAEVVVCSFFVALYVTLIGDFEKQYFDILAATAGYLALTLIFPYLFLELSFCLADARKPQAKEMQADNRLRFYDNRHALKFVVGAEHLLFIKADENYVTIHYNEGENLKTYEMRCSMKSLEDICADNGIVRCHRSYFINPSHVKALRKEKENMIVAEMDTAAETLIPVSKKYYDNLASTL